MMLKIIMRDLEFSIEIGAQEPIIEIKKKIEVLLNVPIASQTLSIWGFELVDGLDIDDYPYINESPKVYLNINNYNKLQITLRWNSRKINIEVDRSETVGNLKQKVHHIDGTPVTRLGLLFAGFKLENNYCYLTDYGVTDYSEIVVFNTDPSPPPPTRRRVISILVQTSSSLLNGAKIPLVLCDSTTVAAMKQMLLLNTKILPMDDYIFIHKQSIMRDNCTLRWHGVENGDFLYVFKGTVVPGRF